MKNRRKRRDWQIHGYFLGDENSVKHGCDVDIDCSRYPCNGSQRPGNQTGGTGYQSKNRYHIDPSTVKISWEAEKLPGGRTDLLSF